MIELAIRHANCQKCKVIENIEKSKENDKANENRKINAIEKNIQNVFNKIKAQVEHSIMSEEEIIIYNSDFLTYDLFSFSHQKWYKQSVNETKVMETIKNLFEEAEYKVSFKEYSNSWKTRSGKYGILYISW